MAEPEPSPPKPQRRLSEGELRAFLEAAADEPMADLMRFLAFTGSRLDEALGLSWEDVDLEAGTAVIRRPTRLRRKGLPTLCLAFRTIDLPEPAIALLAHRRALAPEGGLVFSDPSCGTRASTRGVADAFRSTSLRAGLPGVNPWVLRRTWAGLLLEAGVPASYVSRSLGHASTAVTAAGQRAGRAAKAGVEAAPIPPERIPTPAWTPVHAMMAASARSSTG